MNTQMALPPSETSTEPAPDSQTDSQAAPASTSLPALTNGQQAFVTVVCEVFASKAIWPKFQYVDDRLDREFSIDVRTIPELPDGVTNASHWTGPISSDVEVWLMPLGLAYCPSGWKILGNFVKFLRWCADREKQQPASSPDKVERPRIASAEVGAALQFSQLELLQIWKLLQFDWVVEQRGINIDARAWDVSVTRDVRRYRQLDSVDQYLDIKRKELAAKTPMPSSITPRPMLSPASLLGLQEAPDAGAARISIEHPQPNDKPHIGIDELHPAVRDPARGLFDDGHYAPAVLEGAKGLRNLVRDKSGRHEFDGKELMARVLNEKRPIIQLADLSSETGRNIQEGHKLLGMGAFVGLRNPGAHEIQDMTAVEALEILATFSLLARQIDRGELVVIPETPASADSSEAERTAKTSILPALRLEPLEGTLAVGIGKDRLDWFLHLVVYAYPTGKTPVVLPHHKTKGEISVGDGAVRFSLTRPAAVPSSYGSQTVEGTPTEALIHEAGALDVISQTSTGALETYSLRPAVITVELAPSLGPPVVLTVELEPQTALANESARWNFRQPDATTQS